jgi:hypothetical protein
MPKPHCWQKQCAQQNLRPLIKAQVTSASLFVALPFQLGIKTVPWWETVLSTRCSLPKTACWEQRPVLEGPWLLCKRMFPLWPASLCTARGGIKIWHDLSSLWACRSLWRQSKQLGSCLLLSMYLVRRIISGDRKQLYLVFTAPYMTQLKWMSPLL